MHARMHTCTHAHTHCLNYQRLCSQHECSTTISLYKSVASSYRWSHAAWQFSVSPVHPPILSDIISHRLKSSCQPFSTTPPPRPLLTPVMNLSASSHIPSSSSSDNGEAFLLLPTQCFHLYFGSLLRFPFFKDSSWLNNGPKVASPHPWDL